MEYARETYSRTGSTLLDSIAIVHPFIISTLLNRVTTSTDAIREVKVMGEREREREGEREREREQKQREGGACVGVTVVLFAS